MAAMDELTKRISRVICERLNPALAEQEMTSETCLLGRGLGLDSMAVLELVTGLEAELDLIIDDAELSREIFDTIGSLASFLQNQIDLK